MWMRMLQSRWGCDINDNIEFEDILWYRLKKKVLLFVNDLSVGGAENVVKNYAYYLDKSKVLCYWRAFDFLYEQFLKDNGIKISFIYSDKECQILNNFVSRIIDHCYRYSRRMG